MTAHSKADGIEAMNKLIEITGLTAEDFYFLDKYDAGDCELEEGTPCVVCNDDDFITAYDHWQNWQIVNDPEEEDRMIDFYMNTLYNDESN